MPQSIVKRAATYALITAISVIAAVAGVLAYDARQNPVSWVAASQYLSGQSIFVPDRELGFVVRPNLSALSDSPDRSYFTNARAARVASPDQPVPARVDFFSVGDSQTLGDGVRSDEAFTSVLARETRLVGLNFGMSGYGGVGSLLLMRRELDLRPRFIVYGFWEDHLNRNVEPCLESGMPFCTPRPIVVFDSSRPRIQLPEDPSTALARARRWYGHSGPPFFKDFTAAASRNWDTLKTWLSGHRDGAATATSIKIRATVYVLEEMKAAADSVGARLVVVYLPLYFADISDVPPEIASFARHAGIVLVDMAPRLREMRQREVVIPIPGNSHITAAVHRAIAEEIARSLRDGAR